MIPALVLAVLTAGSQSQGTSPTLGAELSKHVSTLPPIEDLDKRITSYAVLDTPEWFAIGYYWHQPDDRLPEEVRVRTYDRRGNRWRSAIFKEHFGSVLHVRRHQGRFYVTGSYTPSAAPTFVLSDDLQLKRRLNGWPALLLPDGRVVFHDSMVHFAATHPASLSLYDPRNDTVFRLYPAREEAGGLTRVQRTISSVTREPGGTLTIAVIEQPVTIQPDSSARAEGPERRFVAKCDVTGARPRCTDN